MEPPTKPSRVDEIVKSLVGEIELNNLRLREGRIVRTDRSILDEFRHQLYELVVEALSPSIGDYARKETLEELARLFNQPKGGK